MTVLGIDVGGTKTLVALYGGDGGEIASRTLATPVAGGPVEVIGAIAATVAELEREYPRAGAAGVGFAGLVDGSTGVVDSSVIVPGFEGFALAAALAEQLDRPVTVENDATAAGYGEYVALGRTPGLDLLVLTVGTGIGGAVILDGTLRRGASGAAGEFGNMTIDWQGEEFASGNRGCLNTWASGRGIVARAARITRARGGQLADVSPLRLEDVARAAGAGDRAAVEAIDTGARALGAGIANLILAFNPHRVSLMGGVLRLGERFLELAREEARGRCFPRAFRGVEIERCVRGELSGAFGAAMLAQEAHLP